MHTNRWRQSTARCALVRRGVWLCALCVACGSTPAATTDTSDDTAPACTLPLTALDAKTRATSHDQAVVAAQNVCQYCNISSALDVSCADGFVVDLSGSETWWFNTAGALIAYRESGASPVAGCSAVTYGSFSPDCDPDTHSGWEDAFPNLCLSAAAHCEVLITDAGDQTSLGDAASVTPDGG